MSPILGEFARAMDFGLRGLESRTVTNVVKSIQPVIDRIAVIERALADQSEFNKSFAQTIVGIGPHVAAGAEATAAAGTAPAGGPRSQMRAAGGADQGQPAAAAQPQVIQKSFGPGGLDTGANALAKSQIVDVMTDLVVKGKMSSLEVVKYESTGQMSPQANQLVAQAVNGGNAQ